MDYTFNTLNDKEFELLVRDLFQKENQITLENFKSGKDQGIDLRYAKSTENDLVIQCKHWLNSGLSKLKYHLKNDELKKVKKLNPRRYIIATSLPLSPSDKDEILEIFTPYIIQPSDIIGKETLNNLIGKYHDIEEKHYKLWLSSTQVLKKIFNEYIRERSRLYTEEIIEKIKKFVSTDSLLKAQKILDKENILLITGEPGIGKTMLADFLVFKLLKDDFELTYIQNDLKDAERVFSREKKQVFYFDDFLGRNYLEILSEKKFDSEIRHLINAIRSSSNHFFILTSRTTIYNSAKYKSEYFDDEKFDASNIQLELTDYSYSERGEILYNHMYHSDLNDKYKAEIKDNQFYLKIVEHDNYNPRIIEFITDNKRIEITKPDNYSQFILDSLDNPIKIWEKAFHNEISELGRFFLQTLFSFPLPIEEPKFRKAFKSRLEYESKHYGLKIPSNYYHETIKSLLNGFIKRHISTRRQRTHYLDFINPSVADFFSNYLTNKKEDCNRIIKSAEYYDQLRYRFILKPSSVSSLFSFKEIEGLIKPLIIKESNNRFSYRLNQLVDIYGIENLQPFISELIPYHLDSDVYTSSYAIRLFKKCSKSPTSKKIIADRIEEYTSYLKQCVRDTYDLGNFKVFLEEFGINSNNFIRNNSDEILHNLKDYFKEYLEEIDKYDITLPVTDDPDNFKSELYWRIEDLLDERISELEYELETMGIDTDKIRDFEIKYFGPDIDVIFEEIINDLRPTNESKRPTKKPNQNMSYSEYLDNLFS